MNKRLKLYGIIFGIIYFCVLGEKLVSDFVPSFVSGFKAGYNAGMESAENGSDANGILQSAPELLAFCVHPSSGYDSFPTQIKNLKNGSLLQVRASEFSALLPHFERPLWLKIASGLRTFFSFLMFVILIYVPILIFLIVRSVVKNDIFDTINI
ncbi:MAG: hypothetical protein LBN23_07150, partial [Paludibacter sp.]|nr:hypothetical protein [Paludibacter sp.]